MSSGQGSGRYTVFPACAFDDTRMTLSLIAVLGLLGTYGDQLGYCYPAQGTLARRLGISRQAIGKSLARLEELGYISSQRRRRGSDAGETTKGYVLHVDYALPLAHYRVAPDPTPFAPPATSEVAPPATLVVAPPATSEVAPRTYPSERPNKHTHSLATAPTAATMTAATPRECGFAFLENEALYHEALKLLPRPTTKTEIGRWAKAISELREIGATPAQLRTVVRRFRERHPGARLTITAVSGNWTAMLEGDKPHGASQQDQPQSVEQLRAAKERKDAEWAAAYASALAELDGRMDAPAAPDAQRLPR